MSGAEVGLRDTVREIELTAKSIRESAQRVAVAAESFSASALRASYLAGLRDGAMSALLLALFVFVVFRGKRG